MTNKEVTLCFAFNLLTMSEDPRGFEKHCKRVKQKLWLNRPGNREKKRESDSAYYSENKEEILEKNLEYAAENPEIIKRAKRAYYARNTEASKQRATAHRRSPAGRAWMRGWAKQKRVNDPSWRLEQNTRSRIYGALFSQGKDKNTSTLEVLGVRSRQEFFDLISAKLPEHFTWGNYGDVWELDHIRPCSTFDLSDPEQLKQCFHHSNYQPLSVFDNRAKGAKWPSP